MTPRVSAAAAWVSLMLVLAACGAASNEPTATPRPSATPIPTFAFTVPTEPSVFATAAATLAANDTSGDTQAIERGRGRYEALECASCHGENGEGGENGPSLVDYDDSEDAFITFMRSGGALGAEHQFSTDRLSASGGRNLYAYIISLGE